MPRRYLLSQVAENVGRSDPFALPVFEPTAAQERQLRRIVRKLLKEWGDAVREVALPAYQRVAAFGEVGEIGFGFGGEAAVSQLEASLTQATARTTAFAATLSEPVRQHFTMMARWHQAQFVNSIRRATGANVAPLMSLGEAERVISVYTRRNVSLIRGLSSDIAKRVETAVYESFETRTPISVLKKRLTKDLGFAEGRASTIAQDQIGKYTVSLDRMRHEEAGVTEYKWWTQQDEKVRPSHAAKHGEVFSWDDPPADTGHPGHDINCRCRPLAFIRPGE